MAPSSRSRRTAVTSSTRSQTQTSVLRPGAFGKISKTANARSFSGEKASAAKTVACEQLLTKTGAQKTGTGTATKVLTPEPEVSGSQNARSSRSAPKRKRVEVDSDDDDDDEDNDAAKRQTVELSVDRKVASGKKKQKTQLKLQLLTPPASEQGTDSEATSSPTKESTGRRDCQAARSELPEMLVNMISLHASFLKALSLHYAHNGLSSPAELNVLMASTTRIWKKSTVTRADLQRMLVLHELSSGSDLIVKSNRPRTVPWRNSPFKLISSGLGSNIRTNIEFVGSIGQQGRQFSEQVLQRQYESLVQSLWETCEDQLSFVQTDASTAGLPLLEVQLGTQTQMRHQKASIMRAEVLSKPKSTLPSEAHNTKSGLSLSSLSLSDNTSNDKQAPEEHVTSTIKSRTLSLFDRVRAKNQLNASKSVPTAEQITRRHAIGRIPEVVEFLRMKQGQKQMRAQFASSSSILSDLDLDDGSSFYPRKQRSTVQHPSSSTAPTSATVPNAKISFSLSQIIREVRESVPVPVSDEEIRVIVRILSDELSNELDGWVKMFQLGSVVSVTLSGAGIALSGQDVRKIVENKEKM